MVIKIYLLKTQNNMECPMNLFNLKKLLFVSAVLSCSLLTFTSAKVQASSESLTEYFNDMPWIGLVADKINYGPITISRVHIKNSEKFAIVKPGETIEGSLKYKINSDQSKVNLYHLVIGIKGVGAQDCVTHTLSLWDSKGKGNFTLTAPLKPGVYEVRFLFHEGVTCDDAKEVWNSGEKDPSSKATIGVIIVK